MEIQEACEGYWHCGVGRSYIVCLFASVELGRETLAVHLRGTLEYMGRGLDGYQNIACGLTGCVSGLWDIGNGV